MSVNAKLINRIPFAPVVALMFGGAAAIVMLSTPTWLLEHWTQASGLADMIPAAKAPLGSKARILTTGMAAVGAGFAALLIAFPLGRTFSKPVTRKIKPTKAVAPVESYELGDAPAEEVVTARRRPIFAQQDLGAPFMADEPALATTEASPEPGFAPYEPYVADVAPAYVAPAYEAPAQQSTASYTPPAYTVPEVPAGIMAPSADPAPSQAYDLPVIAAPADPYASEYVEVSAELPVFDMASLAAEVSQQAPAAEELVLDANQIADIPDPVEVQPAYTAPLVFEPSLEATPVAMPIVEAPAPAPAPVAFAPEPAPVAEAAPAQAPSINELMGRVETGVRRRQLANLVSAESLANPVESSVAADEALRDALGTLERLAASAR